MNDVLALSLVALASWLLRIGLIVIVPVSRLPGTLRSSLDHLAPAVLASIVTVDLSHTVPAAPGTTTVVATVAAAVVLAVMAWRTQSAPIMAFLGLAAAAALDLAVG